jgi:two-component system, chemotaxis family, chemotaxis protein CheY
MLAGIVVRAGDEKRPIRSGQHPKPFVNGDFLLCRAGSGPLPDRRGSMVRIDFNRLRFLVIDDNPHMRRIIRTLLHGLGTRDVFEAEDGASGLDAYTHMVPDIVLVDWAMPVFDGLELTRIIRGTEASANPYVPIIMITGHTEQNRVIAARDAGVTEFLAKPISAKALYQRIVNVVAHPRPFIKAKDYFGPDRRRNPNSNYSGPERRRGAAADAVPPQALTGKTQPPP